MNTFEYNNKQQTLLPQDLRNLIPDDDPVLIIDNIIESLDLQSLYIRVPSEGHPSYHPLMMLKILFYSYIEGIYSSRKIMNAIKRDVNFIYLAAYQTPDFRTISDFRKNNIDLLPIIFNQILYKCFEKGLIKFEHVSIDATVLKANASKHKSYTKKQLLNKKQKLYNQISDYFKDSIKQDFDEDGITDNEEFDKIIIKLKKYEQLEKAEEELLQEEQNIPSSSKRTARVNLTDNDSSIQLNSGGVGYVQGYRGVFSVDKDNQIILGLDIASHDKDNKFTESSILDVISLKNNFLGKENKTTKFTLDAGFFNSEALKNLSENKGADLFIPDNYFKKKLSKYDKQNFRYDLNKDEYICPEGKILKFKYRETIRGKKYKIYRCTRDNFSKCPFRNKCSKSKKGRRISRSVNQEYIDQMRKILKTEEGKKIYSQRQFIIEPVFGDLKFNNKFTHFYLRGKTKALGELYLVAIAKNLKKLAKFIVEQEGKTSLNLKNIIEILNIFINSFYFSDFSTFLN